MADVVRFLSCAVPLLPLFLLEFSPRQVDVDESSC
jgi:hypothetical protein